LSAFDIEDPADEDVDLMDYAEMAGSFTGPW
jgi:hypothetical protein